MTPPIKGVFLDITGTLVEKEAWIAGADDVVRWLIESSFAVRLISNTTMKSRCQIQQEFEAMGLALEADWIFTPVRAACAWLKAKKPIHGILPVVHPDLQQDIRELPQTNDETADYVLVGDMDDEWNPAIMNRALRAILSGADLVALQKGRRWIAEDGYRLDCGAYVTALEYASGVQCVAVFGKPNPVFYQMVLQDADVQPGQAIMVGDDIESDYHGARQCGIGGLIVRTGEFSGEIRPPAGVNASDILGSIGDLPAWLEKR